MKKLFIIVFIMTNYVYATSNDKLLTIQRNYCYQIESDILNHVINDTLLSQINDCLQGNTYSFNSSWQCWVDRNCPRPTFERSGNKYKLQSNIESLNEAVTEIEDVIQANKEKQEQARLALQQEQDNRKKIAQDRQARFKKCRADYLKSTEYKNYISAKNSFINKRYNNCINNGYNSLNCWSFKLQDGIGYDMTHKAPGSNCR